MWLERITDRPELVHPIVANMRAADRSEVFATRDNDLESLLVHEIIESGTVGWVAGLDTPIAAFGCTPLWPGVWSMWLMATDDFGRIGISMTKLVARSIVPMLFDGGAHRLEARSMEGHTHAQRWLEMIGASREGTLKGYGRQREDFHVYAWEAR